MAVQRYPNRTRPRHRPVTVKTLVIGEHTYRVDRLTPWDAFHVMRRISPALVGIGPQILGLASAETEEQRALQFMQAVFGEGGIRFAQMLSAMPDGDLDYAAMKCLRAVTISQGPAWAAVVAGGSDKPQMMFPHMKLPVILRLITEVLKEELTDFLAVGRSSETGPTSQTA